jgi:AAA domain
MSFCFVFCKARRRFEIPPLSEGCGFLHLVNIEAALLKHRIRLRRCIFRISTNHKLKQYLRWSPRRRLLLSTVSSTTESVLPCSLFRRVAGPPGTGKTTTISRAASIWLRNDVPTWIVAHSNVAVKNIAEKLYKCDVDFRIIVSKEFHFEWWVAGCH